MNKVSNIKERIKVFAETTGVSREIFFKNIGATAANFRGDKLKTGVNADLIEKIVSLYPHIDLHWLITGEKKIEPIMANEPRENYNKKDTGLSSEIKKIIREETKELKEKLDRVLVVQEYLLTLNQIDAALIDDLIEEKQKLTKKTGL